MIDGPEMPDPVGGTRPGRTWRRRLRVPLAAAVVLVAAGSVFAVMPSASAALSFPIESLDGGGNNVNNPTFGQANRPYSRVGTAHYADGISTMISGNAPRNSSNRIMNDVHQNVFSERRLTQWAWTWGQFLDHTFGLRLDSGPGATVANIPFSTNDNDEKFTNNLGVIPFTRSAAAPGTGTSTSNPRQQVNTLPSYISANVVYGADNARLDWLRNGSQDGNPANNDATLLLPGGYLPRKTARGNASTAPAMETVGRLAANPANAAVAGDKRANENIALTATHTLFAREHNRIVGLLPNTLSQEDKFQIARRVVIAEEQYVTYHEWLPAMGVALPQYTGYKSNVDTTLSNEFATIGYRAHSQIHGEFEMEQPIGRFSAQQLADFQNQGLEVQNPSPENANEVLIAVKLNTALSNPDLLQALGEGPVLQMLSGESQYKNDEQMDDALRSILMQIPISNNADCLDGPTQPQCFNGVNDLGALDIQRGRDHGIGTYNQLRQAYGLPAKTSFTSITGEATDAFPTNDPTITGNPINDPNILDVIQLFNVDGVAIDPNDADAVANTATREVRRTTLAARLKGTYQTVDNIDAFTGMISEQHVAGTEFGELQLAIWTKEFTKLRDGDRFFFGNDQGLSTIRDTYGIDFRKTLKEIVLANSDANSEEIETNAFIVPDDKFAAATCEIDYNFTKVSGANAFNGTINIKNTSNQTISGWTLRFQWAHGQTIQSDTGINITQSGPNGRNVAATDVGGAGGVLSPGEVTQTSFTAAFDGVVNSRPPNFTLNNRRCTTPQQSNR